MTATTTIEEVQYHQGVCLECNVISHPFIHEPEAIIWAATHDAENHGDNGATDDDYERSKEARDE